MGKQKSKKDFKKSVPVKEEKFIDEENDRKSIILILIAIVGVLALIITSIFLFEEKEPKPSEEDGQKIEIKVPPVVDNEKETENKIAVGKTKYIVKYLDHEGNQIGKTQKVLDLEDRVNEKPPKIDGKRFREWKVEYDKVKDVYYYIASYVSNVERVPIDEEPYLENNDNYTATVSKVDLNQVQILVNEIEEEQITNPTYVVEVTGEVDETNLTSLNEEISEATPGEELSIEEEYAHIIALRFNAPEDVTKEDIEKMLVTIYEEDGETSLEDGKYHYNGEELNDKGELKTGRELLDSTDEEYENNIFYFNYYQEVDTKENTVVEVYWGNDDEADADADVPILPKDEYVEVYIIDTQSVDTEEENEA